MRDIRTRVTEALGHRLDWPGATPYPYGEDSTEGWACTGPLLSRFKLSLVRTSTGWWHVTGERGRESYAEQPCQAVAEWVAAHGHKYQVAAA